MRAAYVNTDALAAEAIDLAARRNGHVSSNTAHLRPLYLQPAERCAHKQLGGVKMVKVKDDDLAEAADLLRLLLDELEVPSGDQHAVAMVRRLQGAATALEAAAKNR